MQECIICYEKSVDTIYETDCKHLFHVGCLKKWYDIKKSCPYCRRELSDNIIWNTSPYTTVPTEMDMAARNYVENFFTPNNNYDDIFMLVVSINYLLKCDGSAIERN